MARTKKERKPPTPVPLVVPILPGEKEPTYEPEPPMSLVRTRAVEWAIECGFNKDLDVSGPDRVNYPREGHGYVVVLHERNGKQRMATARFDSRGNRSYWTIDGHVV